MDESHALHAIPLFSHLDSTESAELLALMNHECFRAGDLVIREREPGDCLYVVVEGSAQVRTTDRAGGDVILAEVGPGAFFGELSLLTGEPRSASVIALADTVTLALSRAEFLAFLDDHHHACRTILTVLAERLSSTSALVRAGMRSVNDIADEQSTLGQRIADGFTRVMGSWAFIGVQSTILIAYVAWNVRVTGHAFDPYPFLLMSLILSFEAAYAAPIIMMSQNRQAAKDRLTVKSNHEVNVQASVEIGRILERLDFIESLLAPRA